MADELFDRLADELDFASGDRVVPLVNGLGATPIEELYILWRRIAARLRDAGLEAVNPMIGNYVTAMEMAGASLSLMKLDDDLEALMRAPAACPFWRVGQ